MWSLRAACAALTGSTLPVAAPSEISTIAEGGRLPRTPGARRRMLVAAWIASPVPVPPRAASWSSAALTATRSFVGDASTRGLLLSAITPTLTLLGTLDTKRLAAARAAARRVGLTSVASIEPLTSVTSMIDARSTGTATVFSGRAAARMRIASASRKASIGTWGRQRRRGERLGGAPAIALVRPVQDDERRDGHEGDEDEGRCEAHGVRAGR